jgi:serine/threonine-protein kinase
MAEVFLARTTGPAGFTRQVVVKRLYSHMAEDARLVSLFQFEAKLLAELSHPNIPQVYDLAEADGQWYIAMEYVRGMSVSELWQQGARVGNAMPLPVAVGIVSQAAEALHHAHERRDARDRALRLVHRDVNPHNLMVTPDGAVKVLDFGIAQSTARPDTNAGTLRGTLAYMAPEQVRGRPLDKRADVFALGVVLYELTTGTRLYRGPDVQVMTKIVEEDPPPPSMRVPNYPSDLEAVVMSALVRQRARRVPSAAHLASALEQLALANGLQIGPRAIARYVRSLSTGEVGERMSEEPTAPMDPAAVDDALAAFDDDDADADGSDDDDDEDKTLSSGELQPIFIEEEDTTDPAGGGELRGVPSEVPTAPRLSRDELMAGRPDGEAVARPSGERETIPPTPGEHDYVSDLERRFDATDDT